MNNGNVGPEVQKDPVIFQRNLICIRYQPFEYSEIGCLLGCPEQIAATNIVMTPNFKKVNILYWFEK